MSLKGLSRKLLAAAGTTTVQDLAAAGGGHARTETMAALAHEFARLIGALHGLKAPKGLKRAGFLGGADPPCQRGPKPLFLNNISVAYYDPVAAGVRPPDIAAFDLGDTMQATAFTHHHGGGMAHGLELGF